MNNYVPFLKIKANEIGALNTLDSGLKGVVTPFFDFPRHKEGTTAEMFADMVTRAERSFQKNLKGFSTFYLDNFDIEDTVVIGGGDNYQFVIDTFSKLPFIPVVGLDRTAKRNQIVFDSRRTGKILSDKIALRLQAEDFEDFGLVQKEIQQLINAGKGLFNEWIVILDNRMCVDIDVGKRVGVLAKFVPLLLGVTAVSSAIICGSSIPASIGDIADTSSEVVHGRRELSIFQGVLAACGPDRLILGDYTVVSPLYSDIDVAPEVLRNITAPKIIYSVNSDHHIFRGAGLASHARGNLQYNDMAARLTSLPIFRSAAYSFGDDFLAQKAAGIGNNVTPSSILKPTINAHITYMYNDFKF